MNQLFLALAAFVALHSVPALPPVRAGAVALLGRKTYLGLYSLVSILVLGWVFHAALNAPYIELWEPSARNALAAIVLAPIGLFLVLAGLLAPNPVSITLRQGNRPGAIVAITRHPVLWGFLLWASGHLIANGDLRSLILFGGLALFSATGFPMLDKRARRRLGSDWQAIENRTSVIPFLAIASGRSRPEIDAPLAIALALTASVTAWLLLGGHAALFGADPLLSLTI